MLPMLTHGATCCRRFAAAPNEAPQVPSPSFPGSALERTALRLCLIRPAVSAPRSRGTKRRMPPCSRMGLRAVAASRLLQMKRRRSQVPRSRAPPWNEEEAPHAPMLTHGATCRRRFAAVPNEAPRVPSSHASSSPRCGRASVQCVPGRSPGTRGQAPMRSPPPDCIESAETSRFQTAGEILQTVRLRSPDKPGRLHNPQKYPSS